MVKNYTERLGGEYDMELRIRFFPVHRQQEPHSPSEHLRMRYYAGFKGVVFLLIVCTAVLMYNST